MSEMTEMNVEGGNSMRWLGMISGTSLDAVDAVVIEFTLRSDGVLEARVVGGRSTPYPPALRARLVTALPPGPCTAHELTQLDTLVGQHFAVVAAAVVDELGPVDAVSSHGQTTYHWVEDGHALGTMQIGQPAWIAERLGVPVVSDLRARDVAAQGHGAPLVPLLDVLALAGASGDHASAEVVAALNLGGISNLTRVEPALPAHEAGGDAGTGPSITAYDIGPANALVDAVVTDRGLTPEGYDVGGAIAASGTVDVELLETLLADPYYDLPAPKSTGKEYFHLDLVRAALGDRELADADLIATLTRLTAEVVGRELLRTGVTRVLASGGGCDNPVLMRALAEAAPGVQVTTTADLGIPTDLKEAFAFALMGWATWHGLPGNVPAATGASGPRLLGSITPGATPLHLPEPLTSLPHAFVVVT
ncbi:anhydro-N-acetylmuramic acid kinase [Knoellia sp. S7-12]|uniref:anhydro-N-acetylmuramic acid kinase n=1 Tax=Knoellia sp. S7-12 TaxID=3126698 RepID=UPI003367206A